MNKGKYYKVWYRTAYVLDSEEQFINVHAKTKKHARRRFRDETFLGVNPLCDLGRAITITRIEDSDYKMQKRGVVL